jgi:hypothetical protein
LCWGIKMKTILMAALGAVSLVASPASAAVTFTFASWTQDLGSGYPISKTGNSISGSGDAIVEFDSIAPLPMFNNLPVDFTFNATTTGDVGAAPGFPGVFAQGLQGGALVFSTASIANLLTINFTGGALWGAGNQWSIESANGISNVTFSSGVGSFAGFDPSLNAFSIDFDLQQAIRPTVGGTLPDFSARFQGQALGGGAIPEPATWGMMIMGFAGMGAALRGRRRAAAA